MDSFQPPAPFERGRFSRNKRHHRRKRITNIWASFCRLWRAEKSGALFQFLKGRWSIGPLWKPRRSSKPADWMAAAASSLTSAEGCSARCKDGCEMSGTGSPSRHTSRERHLRTGLAYRLTEKRRQSGFKNRQRPVILAPHTRWANCCVRRSRSRRPFTFKAVGRNGKRRISSYFCVKSCVSISVIVMCER